MRRRILITLAIVVGLTLGVMAAAVHFVRGPSFLDAGTTLIVSGKLAGLGVGDVTILVHAAGVATVECTNPAGNVAPGQDTAIEAAGSITLPAGKNGNLVFTVSTVEPSIPSTPACPNPQWAADATDVSFGAGTLTVIQGGVVVLTTTF